MISVTIDTNDVFNALDAAQQMNVLRPPMVRSLARLQNAMARYPAPPSGSQYRRTGNYGREFTQAIDESGDSITGTLGNAVRDKRGRSYGPYVGDSERQSRVHRGRWLNDEEAVTQHMDAIVDDFGQAINGMMNR